MRIQFINQLDMQWVKGFKKAFEDCETRWNGTIRSLEESMWPDVRVFMWLYPEVADAIKWTPPGVKNVVYIRRFEFYNGNLIESVDWGKVGAVIMVNDALAHGFHQRTGKHAHVVYNAIDPDDWTISEESSPVDIAWVGFVNQKKNLPLALQIMSELPRDYVLHVAGEIQCAESLEYAVNMANQMGVQVRFYRHIKPEWMDEWMNGKRYILNTSISEGCPNSVIEAMAKGIIPVVHRWPGAVEQFGENYTFNTVKEAVDRIKSLITYRVKVREMAIERFGPSNYQAVRRIIEGVL